MVCHVGGKTWAEGFGNRELRKIFWPKKAVVTTDLGNVQNGDLHDYC